MTKKQKRKGPRGDDIADVAGLRSVDVVLVIGSGLEFLGKYCREVMWVDSVEDASWAVTMSGNKPDVVFVNRLDDHRQVRAIASLGARLVIYTGRSFSEDNPLGLLAHRLDTKVETNAHVWSFDSSIGRVVVSDGRFDPTMAEAMT